MDCSVNNPECNGPDKEGACPACVTIRAHKFYYKRGKVNQNIFSGKSVVIPMADVQHVEKTFHDRNMVSGAKKGDLAGAQIITKHTRWDMEADTWANAIWLGAEETITFLTAWRYYRCQLEGNIKGSEDK